MRVEEIEKSLKHIKDRTRYSNISTTINLGVVKLSAEALEKQLPKESIKTEKSSQACPVCKYNVNWNYCSNCGQRIKY